MKTLFINIFWLAVVAVAAGCAPDGAFLRADVETVKIAAENTSDHAIGISASSTWMVDTRSTPEWFSVRYDASDPGLLVVKALSANESEANRTGEITVVSGDGLILRIPFVQLAMVVSFDVTPATLEPFGPRDDSPRTLAVATGLTWEFSTIGRSDWLTVERGTAEGTENTLTVSARHTRLLDVRRDTIVLRPVNDAFWTKHTYSIPVLQRGIDLVVDSESMDYDTFEIEVPAAGGEVALSVSSRFAWSVATHADPERLTLDLTEGGADIENGITMVMTAAPNTSTEEYTFKLTFESGGETYEYICRQKGGQPQVEEGT